MKRKHIFLVVLSLIIMLAASCRSITAIPDSTELPPIVLDLATSEPRTYNSPNSESSACKEILFTYFSSSRQGNGTDILAFCTDGSDSRQLTTVGPNTYAPRWSPDRTQIAYLSDSSGSEQLHIIDRNGGIDRQITSASDLEAWNLLWLPDDNRIAIWGVFNDDLQWQAVNLLTGEISSLSEWEFEGGDVSLSHDGTRIAYTAHTNPDDHESPVEIFIQYIDGSNSYQLTSTGWDIQNPVWSPDDSQIAFLTCIEDTADQNPNEPFPNAIYTINLDGSSLHKPCVLSLNPDRIAWSPDSESLAVIAKEIQSTGDLFNPEITVYTLNTLNIKTCEKSVLYDAIAPNRIKHVDW